MAIFVLARFINSVPLGGEFPPLGSARQDFRWSPFDPPTPKWRGLELAVVRGDETERRRNDGPVRPE